MSDHQKKSSRGWNRLTLMLIGGVPLLVMLAATWLWVFVARGELDLVGMLGTANRGILVRPMMSVEDLPLRQIDGEELRFAELPRLWTLVVPATEQCNAECAETLYLTRQVRLALGGDGLRVRRWYLNLGAPLLRETEALIGDSHPDLQTVVASRDKFASLVAQARLEGRILEPGTWWVIDPMGWIMMLYTADNSYKDSIGDLKFLLKNTSEEGLP